FSLVVAISGYRHATLGTMARDRARRYAIAFGFNDALTMIVTTIVPGVYGATHGGDLHPIEFVFVWAIPIVETIWVLLMTYGILRTQLFDIDLHLATGVRRGAIAAVVLFAFFAAAEIAKTVVSQDFGYIVGAFAAAALLLIHKPVERFAAGLSSTVLPGVTGSPAYLSFRKLEVYADALEAAYEDGRISKKDRVILNRLCAKLEVDPEDATRVEHDVRDMRERSQHKRGKRASVKDVYEQHER
ncbi:MAG TPA: hypothetical protein VLV86_19250, partial [Vicinamibacterales bacterium]|nr:hypothetical protein [Vicinamibacterales bacterium]